MALRTDEGRLVRVVIASSAPVSSWIEAGDRVHVSGKLVQKQWRDGWHETLSAHEGIEIVKSRLTLYGGMSAWAISTAWS